MTDNYFSDKSEAVLWRRKPPRTHPGLQLADNSLATDNCVSLDFFQTNGQVLDFYFQWFLDCLDLDDAFLFLVEDFDCVFQFDLDALVALIGDLVKNALGLESGSSDRITYDKKWKTHSKFFGDFVVVVGELRKFLLDLWLGRSQIDVDCGQFVDSARSFLKALFCVSLGSECLKTNKNGC